MAGLGDSSEAMPLGTVPEWTATEATAFGASDIAEHLGQVIADILEHRGDSQNL